VKTYLINLDRSTERLAFIMAQARPLGLEVERVPAICGHTLPNELVARYAALPAHHATCGNPLLRGEIACMLSHRQAWLRFLDGGGPWAFFAEDDIHLVAAAARFIGREDWFAPGVEIVKAETVFTRLVASWPHARLFDGFVTRHLWSFHWGAAGYFLSRAAAGRLATIKLREGMPVDFLLFGNGAPHLLPVHQLMPALCVQDVVLAARGRRRSALRSEIDAVEPRFITSETSMTQAVRSAGLLDELRFQAHRLSNHLHRRAWVGRVPLAPLP